MTQNPQAPADLPTPTPREADASAAPHSSDSTLDTGRIDHLLDGFDVGQVEITGQSAFCEGSKIGDHVAGGAGANRQRSDDSGGGH